MSGILRFVREAPHVQTKGERLVARLMCNRRERLPMSSKWSERKRNYMSDEEWEAIQRRRYVMPPPRYGFY